ncbi:MAG: Ku protein [Hyphomicrobiales bacterium]|nr:Ku protein [Hyphomicrobiales bacterium]
MPERIRTFWKGHLRLSLVIIPVRMVTATRSDGQISFHQVHRETKQRIRYQKTAPGVGKVDQSDIVSGYEVEPGQYVLFEGEELDELKLKTRHTIELTQFVDACEIDPLYFDRPYYLLPDGDVAEEGYRIIRDALRASKKVGVGQLTLRGKEHLIALKPCGAGLLLETLRYEEEIKEADDVFADIGSGKLRSDLIDMAADLIERKSAPFDAGAYKNHYAAALRDLVQSKVKGGEAVAVGDEEEGKPGTVLDFMEALRRSVAQDNAGPREPSKKQPVEPRRAVSKRGSDEARPVANAKPAKPRADAARSRRKAS